MHSLIQHISARHGIHDSITLVCYYFDGSLLLGWHTSCTVHFTVIVSVIIIINSSSNHSARIRFLRFFENSKNFLRFFLSVMSKKRKKT